MRSVIGVGRGFDPVAGDGWCAGGGGDSGAGAPDGQPVESWKRAAEVTSQLKARIEQMKVYFSSLFVSCFDGGVRRLMIAIGATGVDTTALRFHRALYWSGGESSYGGRRGFGNGSYSIVLTVLIAKWAKTALSLFFSLCQMIPGSHGPSRSGLCFFHRWRCDRCISCATLC